MLLFVSVILIFLMAAFRLGGVDKAILKLPVTSGMEQAAARAAVNVQS